MRALLKELAIAAVLLFVLTNIISYLRQPELGSTTLPQVDVQLIDGSTFQVKKGKPFIIHFWATSCPACKLEAPNIQRVSKEYDLLSIAVNSGSDEKVKSYIQEHGFHFNVFNDVDGAWAREFNIEAYPTTFIYDAKGELRFTEVGYTSTAGLLARLKWIE